VYYMSSRGQESSRESGYAMAALLVVVAVMAIAMSVALPTWRQMVQREKEQELIFRGQQYVRAIQLYQRRFAGAYPPDFDTLVKAHFLRKKYKDPMVDDGVFEIVYQGSMIMPPPGRGGSAGQRGGVTGAQPAFSFDSRSGTSTQARQIVGPRGGVVGVRSKNTSESIRVYNGATHYNEWRFVYTPTMLGPGQGRPGMGPGRGGPGGTPPGRGGPGGMGPGRGGPGGQRGGPGDQPVRRPPGSGGPGS
jgi:type II secretory pathway pseudopilin PulG